MNPQIRGPHHNAWRCSDSERTRRFYEDFLGLPLGETKTGRRTQALHSFSRLGDGSFLAFFEVPDIPLAFKLCQRDPDGYVVELCARREAPAAAPDLAQARAQRDRWQAGKAAA